MAALSKNPNYHVSEIRLSYKSKVSHDKRPSVHSSQDAFAIFKKSWDNCIIEIQEQFKILLLNKAHRVLGIYESCSGGSDAVIIDLRLLFTCVLKANASCVILCHNHPSGGLKPSDADKKLTNKINEVGRLLNIKILDHLIISRQGYYSFADEGLL